MAKTTKTTLVMMSLLTLAAPRASRASEQPSHANAVGHGGQGAAPADVLKELVQGNARFVEGRPARKDLGPERRRELAGGQHPKAIVVSCSDSRVPPELLFDQGLGDLFVVRVAGNVAEPDTIGSVEYAAEHLGTRLVVVLGHHSCGAVKAALGSAAVEGNIGVVVSDIAPAVAAARRGAMGGAAGLEDAAVHENARTTARLLTERCGPLRHLVAAGKVRIVVGVYDLESGKVEFEAGSPAKVAHDGEAAPRIATAEPAAHGGGHGR